VSSRSYRGRCGCCGERRQCWQIMRFGGGTYRRAGRHYPGSICEPCVRRMVKATEHRQPSESTERYSVGTLRRLAAKIDAEVTG
jgi:hypothetical protein